MKMSSRSIHPIDKSSHAGSSLMMKITTEEKDDMTNSSANSVRRTPCLLLMLAITCMSASVSAKESIEVKTTTKEAVKNTENSDKVAESSVKDSAQTDSTETRSSQWVVKAEQWELVRDGESILALPALNALVNQWLGEQDMLIEVQYPGGEEGEFWVHQVIDWLVSLGIPSDRMVAVRGSGADDIIRFNLVK